MPPRSNNKKPITEEGSLQQSASRKRSSRTRISAACEACKKRKTKCTGEPVPCHLCKLLGTECVIDIAQDMRRRAAIQQTIHDSKSYQESLSGLIDCIRHGDPEVIQSLQEIFRQDSVTKDEISGAIQHWTQVSRSRLTDLEIPNSFALEAQIDGEQHDQVTFQMGTEAEAQSESWILDPRLSEDSPSDRGLQSSGFGSIVLNRLRQCSDVEGERVLAYLLEAQSMAEVETRLRADDLNQSQYHGIDMSEPVLLNSEDANIERINWHPALQQTSDLLSLGTPKDNKSKSTALPMRQSFPEINATSRGSSRYATRALVTTTKPADVGNQPMLGDQLDGSTEQEHAGRDVDLSSRVVTMSYQGHSGVITYMGHVPMTSLLVAKSTLGTPAQLPVHLVLTLLTPDNSFMSRVYTDYLHGARQTMETKIPVTDVLGSNDDIIVNLIFRSRQQEDPWDCSSWACEACRDFPDFDIYVRLACVFMLTRFMQWLLVPTAETYAKVPDMMKPTPAQRMIPHIGAIDLVPFPCVRDAAIEHLRDWLTPLAKAKCTVNWPYFQDDAVEFEPGSSSRRLTQRFLDHVSNYGNWSVGSHFLQSFPEATGRLRIHHE